MSRDWSALKAYTLARIGLKHSGFSIGTNELLAFKLAHAQARAAVLKNLDAAGFAQQLKKESFASIHLTSMAPNREAYLLNPDLGRRLSPESILLLKKSSSQLKIKVSFVVSDGLSAPAIEKHFILFWKIFSPLFEKSFGPTGPLMIVPFGRVAVSDQIGECLGAEMSVIFVGERPGLSSSDSLGIYMTYAPLTKNLDSARNCISNIHPPAGMDYEIAAQKLLYLISESLRLKLSGVNLKDNFEAQIKSTDPKSILTGNS